MDNCANARRLLMNNKSLLLVDDEISILRSYARDLSVQSYDVTTAMNAEIAITEENRQA